MERGVNPATYNNAALRFACRNGLTDVVRMLLALPPERGIDPAVDNNVAIRTASAHGHIEIVRLLLDLPPKRGVNPTALNNEALQNTKTLKEIHTLLKMKIPWYRRLLF